MDYAKGREPSESRHVAERGAGPTSPAVRSCYEAGVEDEEQEGEPVGDAGGEGGADEVQLEGVDEKVVEAHV